MKTLVENRLFSPLSFDIKAFTMNRGNLRLFAPRSVKTGGASIMMTDSDVKTRTARKAGPCTNASVAKRGRSPLSNLGVVG